MAIAAWIGVVLVHLTVIDRRLRPHVHPVGQGPDRFVADARGEVSTRPCGISRTDFGRTRHLWSCRRGSC